MSLIPPSTDTYLRSAPLSNVTDFVVPTKYIVVVVGPTIALPGSIEILGIDNFAFAHSSLITVAMAGITSSGAIAVSSLVYAILPILRQAVGLLL